MSVTVIETKRSWREYQKYLERKTKSELVSLLLEMARENERLEREVEVLNRIAPQAGL